VIAIWGAKSTIAFEMGRLIPSAEDAEIVAHDAPLEFKRRTGGRYLICIGKLLPKTAAEMTFAERRSIEVSNYLTPKEIICKVLFADPAARICVIGSESAYLGSYCQPYADAKAKLHNFVETTRLVFPKQQLVCISPTIIEDARMTTDRDDQEDVARRAKEHPKARFLKSIEVAKLAHHCLYVDDGYLSGVVIRMNGGGHT